MGKYGWNHVKKTILDPHIRSIDIIGIRIIRISTPSIIPILLLIFLWILWILLLLTLLLILGVLLPQIPSLTSIGTFILEVCFEKLFYWPTMWESIEIRLAFTSLEYKMLSIYIYQRKRALTAPIIWPMISFGWPRQGTVQWSPALSARLRTQRYE